MVHVATRPDGGRFTWGGPAGCPYCEGVKEGEMLWLENIASGIGGDAAEPETRHPARVPEPKLEGYTYAILQLRARQGRGGSAVEHYRIAADHLEQFL